VQKYLLSTKSIRQAAQGGFTLIEVMVVVIILGILAAVVVPNVMDKPDEARKTAAANDIKAIESALNMYKLDNFRYPTSDQGLEALVTKPSGTPEPKNWKQYLPRLPKDPWGEPYQYISSDGSTVEIISLGSDSAVGGEGSAADIKNTDLGK